MTTLDRLTKTQRSALYHLCWGLEHFDGASTGRVVRRSVVQKLEAAGIVEYAGNLPMADGDGFAIYPERYHPCWRPTEAGVDIAVEQNVIFAETAEKLRKKLAVIRNPCGECRGSGSVLTDDRRHLVTCSGCEGSGAALAKVTT